MKDLTRQYQALGTPWGCPDSAKEIAPGVVEISTPSHGGIHLSKERQAEVERVMPFFRPFAGPGWYEEDCDWCIVLLVFPELEPAFAPEENALKDAVATARGTARFSLKWKPVVDWLEGPGGASVRQRIGKAIMEGKT
jgi:hypothetical protein